MFCVGSFDFGSSEAKVSLVCVFVCVLGCVCVHVSVCLHFCMRLRLFCRFKQRERGQRFGV